VLSNKSVPVLVIALLAPLAFISTFLIFKSRDKAEVKPVAVRACLDSMNQLRLKNYSLTKPLLLSDVGESSLLDPMRVSVDSLLTDLKAKGMFTEASVYFRRMDDGIWFSLNPNAVFDQELFSDISVLIAYYKTADLHPGFLDQSVSVSGKSLNGTFTIADLMVKLFKDDSEDARKALTDRVDKKILDGLFNDLHMKPSALSIVDLAKFLRLVYNSTYVNDNDLSERLIKLMAENNHTEAIHAAFDPGTKIAGLDKDVRKNGVSEMQEMAIVYVNDNPYLIGVFCKGKESDKLHEVITQVTVTCKNAYTTLYN
jgi:hypothetical protein